jgi:teichuronic acid biosynthesis glycosyltransferase TuaG
MFKKLNEIKIDIILPNYNSNHFFFETINSILNQSFENWKLIIVDDNSNLETKELLKKYSQNSKIEIIWLKKNKGPGFCRNIAIRYSKSDYLAFIDSDDIWYKNKLLEQLNFMLENNYDFTYTNYLPFKVKNNLTKEHYEMNTVFPPKSFNYDLFINNTSIGTSTMMIKNSIVGNAKFTNTKVCEDYYFKCKILKKVQYAHCLEKTLTKYRIRHKSLQSNKLKVLFYIWRLNKNYNHLNFFQNLVSILNISINSFKKYGFK